MNRPIRWWLAALLALLAGGSLGCASTTTPSAPIDLSRVSQANPLVWRGVSPDGSVAYLTGSVHVTREQIDDFGAVVDDAWGDADELVVEVDVTRLSPQEMATLTGRYGSIPRPRDLRDELSEATWHELAAYLDSRGIERDLVIGWKPWFVYFVVVQHDLDRAGFKTETGVDRLFIDAAYQEGKPVKGLETAAAQLQVFDNLPDDLEELLLQDSLRRVDTFAAEAKQLIDAWKDGGEEQLRTLVFQPLVDTPNLEVFYDLVFFQRNRQMVSRLQQLSGDGRTRFVVVGAGHMVGEQSIPSLLAERGWQVERIGGKP